MNRNDIEVNNRSNPTVIPSPHVPIGSVLSESERSNRGCVGSSKEVMQNMKDFPYIVLNVAQIVVLGLVSSCSCI